MKFLFFENVFSLGAFLLNEIDDLAIDLSDFQQRLLSWYEEQQRDLPWRKDSDPYKIWVSEVMLQQTRVETVIPYFCRFIDRFPDLYTLAEASEEEVLRYWQGLGYYSRARHLQEGVREVVTQYGGQIPDNREEISRIKGVGPYTAGAILSIAYGKSEPAVDGNVMRVLSRLFKIEEDITRSTTKKKFEELARVLIPEGKASYFNQALMELGALVCTPKSPGCFLCPVRVDCQAYKEGMTDRLPVKSKKKPPEKVTLAVGLIYDDNGNILIRQRPAKGLLAKMWELPGFEVKGKRNKTTVLTTGLAQAGLEVALTNQLGTHIHTFTHLQWRLFIYEGYLTGPKSQVAENIRFVSFSELQKLPFLSVHQKIIQKQNEHE